MIHWMKRAASQKFHSLLVQSLLQSMVVRLLLLGQLHNLLPYCAMSTPLPFLRPNTKRINCTISDRCQLCPTQDPWLNITASCLVLYPFVYGASCVYSNYAYTMACICGPPEGSTVTLYRMHQNGEQLTRKEKKCLKRYPDLTTITDSECIMELEVSRAKGYWPPHFQGTRFLSN